MHVSALSNANSARQRKNSEPPSMPNGKSADDQTHELRETIRQAVVGDINPDYAGVLLLPIEPLSNYSPELAKLF